MAPPSQNDPSVQRLEGDVRRLTLQMNATRSELGNVQTAVTQQGSAIGLLQQSQNALPAAPVNNFLWNGEEGHSVNSWNDSAYTTDDTSKECAFFCSHHKPFVPIGFTVISSANKIPAAAHGVEDGTLVELSTDGTLPTGTASATRYYTYAPDANNIKLATTQALALAGTPDVSITVATGTGNHKIAPYLYSEDARTTSLNQELKSPTHSTYDINYSDWERTRGFARLNGTRTLDTPIPANFLEPGMTARAGVRVARRNNYIEIPDDALFYGGIVDNTSGQRDFIQGDLEFAGLAIINGATTVTRKYKMFVQTDRGYSILSSEITVTAPDDGQYDSENFVELTWLQVAGYINIQIWMFTPGTGVYRLVADTSSGTASFVDNGSFERTDSGYPTATADVRKAIFFTRTGELANLAIDGGDWDTILVPPFVPENYNKGLTTDRQWFRLGMSKACNLYVGGCTTTGTTTITAPAAAFEAVYTALYPGMTVQLLDPTTLAVLFTKTIASWTSTTQLVLSSSTTAGTYVLRIVGGGFHGIFVDKVFMGLQENVTFAPNPLDARILQPVAAPTAGQGGIGTGGGGGGDGGGVLCVVGGTPIDVGDGSEVANVETLMFGNYVAGENMRPNLVNKLKTGSRRTRLVRTANCIEKRCTDPHRFRMSAIDEIGVALRDLRVGDKVMTRLDGRDELSAIEFIGELGPLEVVYTPVLSGGHFYRAGRWMPAWWQRLLIALKLLKKKRGTIYAHNEKTQDPPVS